MRLLILHIATLFFLFSSALFPQTWQVYSSPTQQNLARLDMVSPSEGWAVSYDGLILKFDGSEWGISDSLSRIEKEHTSPADNAASDAASWGDIYSIRMVDDSFGWISVNQLNNQMYRLIGFDGSAWHPWPEPFSLKLRALDFIDHSNMIAIGEGGGYQYQNGRWEVLALPVSSDFRAVKIVSPDNIFLAGQNGSVLHKKQSWSALNTATSETIRDMDFISHREGWFVGNNGTILHYLDGHFFPEEGQTKADLWAVDMVSAQKGFALGKDGAILEYDGDSWRLLEKIVDADLHDIEMLSSTDGWIIGGRGIILKYGSDPVTTENLAHKFLFMDEVYVGTKYLMDLIDDVRGVTAADFNGDNLPDLYLTCSKSLNHLLLNQGDGYYIDHAISSGTGGDIETRLHKQRLEAGALAADFDRDGDTDIFLAGRGGTTELLVNNGQAIFERADIRTDLEDDLNATSGALADFNADGYPDLLLADQFAGARILLNQKYNRFQPVTLDSMLSSGTGIRAVATGDLNGDFHTDILFLLHQAQPTLLFNDGKGRWKRDLAAFEALTISNFVNGATVADFNNDGFNDVFLTTEDGKDALLIYDSPKQVFLDQSLGRAIKRDGRSYSGSAGDFDLDGDTDLFVSRYGPDFLYLNDGDGLFHEAGAREIHSKAGYISGYNTGTAMADVDDDGDLDLVVGNLEFWSSLLQNTTDDSAYITLHLVGVEDTREALGAKIWVWPANQMHSQQNLLAFREVTPSQGYFSQDWHGVHIGLGEFRAADLRVRFLDGTDFEFTDVSRGSSLTIHQSGTSAQLSYQIARGILQILHTPYIPYEILKFIIFTALILFSVRFIEKRYSWRPTRVVIYVLALMVIYAIMVLILPRSTGVFYHVLPFVMMLFALAVLTTVNEQIRKVTNRRIFLQEKLRETSADLSRTTLVDEAVSLVFKTVKLIQPCRFQAMYMYYPSGNYFLLQKTDRVRLGKKLQKVKLDREEALGLIQADGAIQFSELDSMWPGNKSFTATDTRFFPLVREKELHGVMIVGMEPDRAELDTQTMPMLEYLFLQLSITLHNIQILREMQDQEKLAAIGNFSTSIIHNLKNPVDGLRLMIEALRHDMLPGDPHQEYVRELYQGVRTLKQTLLHSFDIVNVSDDSNEQVSINELLQEVDTHFSNLKYPPLTVYAGSMPAVYGNRMQLRLALENLVENAFEASTRLTPVIVETRVDQSEGMLYIDVMDEGSGIEDEHLGNIFNMFYSTRGSGRGLGLTITRNIIRNHGGYINVVSKPGQGTRVTLVLPAFSQQKDDVSPKQVSMNGQGSAQ